MKRQDSAAGLGGEALDKEVQEAWKELEAARQEREQPAKRSGPFKAGNSRRREKRARADGVESF